MGAAKRLCRARIRRARRHHGLAEPVFADRRVGPSPNAHTWGPHPKDEDTHRWVTTTAPTRRRTTDRAYNAHANVHSVPFIDMSVRAGWIASAARDLSRPPVVVNAVK